MSKYSPWFPVKVKPVRNGIYERQIPTIGIRFSWWNGQWWGGFASNYGHAVSNKAFKTGYPFGKWRGLSRKP